MSLFQDLMGILNTTHQLMQWRDRIHAMFRQSCLRVAIVAIFACPAFSQTKPPIAAANLNTTEAAAAEVLAFERAMEAAVVRGDEAYVERVARPI